MSLPIVFCLLAAAGLLVWRFWLRKPRAKSNTDVQLYLMIYDGASYVLHQAVRQLGCFVVEGIEYPTSACRRIEIYAALDLHIYVFAAEPIALTTHQHLMKNRSSIVKGHLFKGGGDFKQTVFYVMCSVVMACALFMYMSVGEQSAANVRQEVVLEKLDKWTQTVAPK